MRKMGQQLVHKTAFMVMKGLVLMRMIRSMLMAVNTYRRLMMVMGNDAVCQHQV